MENAARRIRFRAGDQIDRTKGGRQEGLAAEPPWRVGEVGKSEGGKVGSLSLRHGGTAGRAGCVIAAAELDEATKLLGLQAGGFGHGSHRDGVDGILPAHDGLLSLAEHAKGTGGRRQMEKNSRQAGPCCRILHV
jgi:hypothetical protein